MLSFTLAMLLAAHVSGDANQAVPSETPASEMELVFEDELESGLVESEDLVLDDSLLTDEDPQLLPLEE
jgi:hypothetical protein